MDLNSVKIDYSELKEKYDLYARRLFEKSLNELDANQLNDVVAGVIKNEIIAPFYENSRTYFSTKRVVGYFSIEFLLGRIVVDALVNAGIKKMTVKIFQDEGVDFDILEDVEDTALGNGGLGRLAACFIESAATKNYPVFGYGIYYKYGLFKQKIENNRQVEIKDDWTCNGDSWFEALEDEAEIVSFQDTQVKAVPYILPIIGYNSMRNCFSQDVYPLTLWKAEPIEGVTNDEAARISDYLYPEDSTDEGKRLRLRQEYFFVSATLQKLLRYHFGKFGTLDNFDEFYCFQMNDTHPVIGCVEFIRLLKQQYGYSFKEASTMAKECFAYTNHTIMAEALEKWPIVIFKDVLPDLFKVIEDLNQELIDDFKERDMFKTNGYVDWGKIRKYELFENGLIHMSRIACYVGFSINGVAAIHSKIIKESTLKEWYEVYPEKFTNCTNGVTPRRWIKEANPYLAGFLDAKLGKGWTTDLTKLEKLEQFKNDPKTLREFASCKQKAKESLAAYIYKHEGIKIDTSSIFDCQVKRIHEYKRQLMNALRILYIYRQLKSGKIENFYNTTFIIGGKAAPGYKMAKLIINLIKDIQDLVNNDPEMEGKMKVVFLTNFNVSYGEKVYAGANYSEQISTAGYEASGTSNMKFMMNGAPTIGTEDGANIEIVGEAGTENNYIFGASVEEFERIKPIYNHKAYFAYVPEVKELLDCLTDGTLGNTYWDIVNTLMYDDKYYVVYDFRSYVEKTLEANQDYALEQTTDDFKYYTLKGFLNTAHSGKFSSDRTIRDYAENIWHITPIK